MFRETRRKIVASIMGALILLFIATLSMIVASVYFESRSDNRELLARYVEIYSLDQQPGTDGPPGDLPDDTIGPPPVADSLFQLSTFYSVALSDSHEVLAIDDGMNELYSKEELLEISDEILATGRDSGDKGILTYQVSVKDGYKLVAFVDNTLALSSLASMIRYTLLVGAAALLVLFFISLRLSRWIVHPLEENDRRQRQFVSDAGHELKTPISVISANAEILARQAGSNEWLDNITYENERMGGLVRQLLDLSRAENAQVMMEQLDLSRLVTGEVLPFESIAFEKGLIIESSIADNIQVHGNRPQLSQLISILLDNAVSHSEGGSEINLSLTSQRRHAVLTVVNSGREIPEDQREHLFERFYRVDEARNSESGHYGLGLAIARAIAEAHGGSISVACRDGKVAFTVHIPLKKA